MRKKLSIVIVIIVIVTAISIVKINNGPRMEALNINNDQENVKGYKEINELEIQRNSELENNELNKQFEKQDTQGEVTIKIAFLNPTHQDEDYFNFEVYLNTHSVELDKYDLGEITTLFIGNNMKIMEGIEWEALGGGHHISGMLKVPREYEGEKTNYVEEDFIELEIKDLADIASRKFKWEKEELTLKENSLGGLKNEE